jgi:hypothetical protein
LEHGGRGIGALESQQAFILDEPLDDLATDELHGLGEGRGEVDIPLLAVLAVNELDLGGESHSSPSAHLAMTRDFRYYLVI